MKRFVTVLIFLSFCLMLTAVASAQPVGVIKVLGVSPRDVAKDTTDIYRIASTGLPNVGVGELVYLTGTAGEEEITEYEWNLSARPNNSQAGISSASDPVITLTPDVAGTYRISLSVTTESGVSDPVVIAINAANFVGVGGITAAPRGAQCAVCHNGGVDEMVGAWQQTKHAVMFQTMITGERGSYRATCVSCHVVGYNTAEGANNGGFDDLAAQEGWSFPQEMNADTWNSMKETYPLTAAMANIQCENCHGPGSAHRGAMADNKIAKTWDAGMCAKCHDSGTHHYRPMQWELSKHSNPVDESGRADCAKCHVGKGFVDKLAGLPDSLINTDYVPITCVVCHDPHDATNEYQLRTVAPVRLANGVMVDFGTGNTCANCHQARRDASTYVLSNITNQSRFNPHYGPQSDMLKGTNAWEFGQQMQSSPHAMVIENGCAGCHMAPAPNDANDPGSFLQLGDHSFHMTTAEGVEHVATCAECHGDIESFEDIMASDDWDGDGTTESAQAEIAGLVEAVSMMLPPVGSPEVVVANWFTPAQRGAAYNVRFIYYDGSKGMHNPAYARSILQAALNADLGVEPLDEPIPAVFSLSAAYPNPFNPVTAFNYAVPRDVDVSIRLYDMAGRLTSTVVSGEMKAGSYRAAVNMTGQPSGVYFLRMEAGDFKASQKLILVK